MTTLPKCYLAYAEADRDEAASFVEAFDSQHTFITCRADVGIDQEIANLFGRHQVLRKIRERWLRDSAVTIVLLGASDTSATHIDWEIAASLFEDESCGRNGLIGITLPAAARSQQNYIPPRFADNWAHGTGYARWFRYPDNTASLESMIADALEARTTRADLVNNRRPLMEGVLKPSRERSRSEVPEDSQ